jgi:hypothetical protein
MGRIMRLREAVQDGQDTEDQIRAGGKPSPGTSKDKRLKENKKAPAKVTRGL